VFGTGQQFQYAGGSAFSRESYAATAMLSRYLDGGYSYVNAIRDKPLFQ
jgi:hypothetical protein